MAPKRDVPAGDRLVSADLLQSHVKRLAADIGERNVFRPRALAQAADYIETTWRGQGYVCTRQWYEVRGVSSANLEVTRPGEGRPDEILLLGAHYDTVRGSPGANDNGSGVAALLELSRLFALAAPTMTVRFVAFVNEEPPFFMTGKQGSRVYARAARARGDDIRLMVSLETIGCYSAEPGSQHYPPFFRFFYPDRGDFLAFVSNLRSRGVMRQSARIFREKSNFPLEHMATLSVIPGVSWSDHRSFWREGFRAFMITDTALYRYPYYHSPGDTPEQLSYQELARVTDGLYRTFEHLARQGLANPEGECRD